MVLYGDLTQWCLHSSDRHSHVIEKSRGRTIKESVSIWGGTEYLIQEREGGVKERERGVKSVLLNMFGRFDQWSARWRARRLG